MIRCVLFPMTTPIILISDITNSRSEINENEGAVKIEFLHPHGSRQSFNRPDVVVPLKNVLCVISSPTTTTASTYKIMMLITTKLCWLMGNLLNDIACFLSCILWYWFQTFIFISALSLVFKIYSEVQSLSPYFPSYFMCFY